MNILLITLEYPPFKGGIANYYENLIKYWPACAEASADKPELNNIFVLNNNDNKLLKRWLWPKWLPAVWHLYKEVKNKKINHILVGQILPLGTVAYIVSKITKTHYSVFLHGMDLSLAMKIPRKKRLALKILDKSENILCSNSYTASTVNDILGGLKNTEPNKKNVKIYTVNPGISSDLVSTISVETKSLLIKKYDLENKIILFSLGRLVKRKGFDTVIKAWPEILKSNPGLVYIIAGTGPHEKYLKELAKELNSSVIFLGSISDGEKWTWLSLCDIFITISRDIDGDYEGFGIVYLEANLAGKPVIAGNSGGVKDAVINNLNGILVDPENKKEITDAILSLSSDPVLREKLGGQGRERVIKEFRWEDKILKIFNIITNNKFNLKFKNQNVK